MHLGINLHLGINYLSKTFNIKGDVLLVPGIENNTHDKEYHNRRLQKPKQNKPETQNWNLWKRVIQLLFTTGSKELKKHLGQWTQKHSNSGTWDSYRIADSNHHVYNLCTNKNNNKYWEKFTLHGTKLRLQEDNIDVGDFNLRMALQFKSEPFQIMEDCMEI